MDWEDERLTKVFIPVLVIFSIATVAITSINFAKINSVSFDFDDIAQNWQTGAIMQITVASQCPTGYEEAFNYTWPGTMTGCWCGDVSLAVQLLFDDNCDYLCRGTCTWSESLSGCDEVRAYKPVVMDVWSQVNYTNSKVCILRSQGTWLQVAQQSGPNCTINNSSLKQCGFSPENMFCTSEAECPINYVQAQNLTLPAQSAQLTNCTTQNNCTVLAQSASSAKVLYYQRGDTYDALPTAQMRLNEYSMCMDMGENDITPDRSDFWLLNDRRSTCYTEGASMWNWTDSMTEAQLFSLNGMTNTIAALEHYGYYPESSDDGNDYIYSVFSRSYIPWNIDCRDDMEALVNHTPAIQMLRNIQLALMIVTIMGGICLGIVIPIMLVYIYKSGEYSGFLRWTRVIHHLAQVPMLGLQIAAFAISKRVKGFFQYIIEDNCSTTAVLQTLNSLADSLQSNFTCNAVNISLQGLLIIFGIYYFHRKFSIFEMPPRQARTYKVTWELPKINF